MINLDFISDWLSTTGFTIVIILAIGWLLRHFGGMVITKIIRRLVRPTKFNKLSREDAKKRQDTLISLFVVLLKIIIFVVMALMIFKQLFPHISLTPILASAGLVGVIVGFGAQAMVKDFLAGIFIIAENQYRVGDVVDIDGAGGTVESVSLRSTVLRDVDGNVHYLSNGNIMHTINKTMGFSKVNFTLTVSPDTDIDRLSEIINDEGKKMADDLAWKDKILEAPQFLKIGTFTDTAVEVIIVGTTQPSAQWGVTGEFRRRLLKSFAKNKIELAHLIPTYPPVK